MLDDVVGSDGQVSARALSESAGGRPSVVSMETLTTRFSEIDRQEAHVRREVHALPGWTGAALVVPFASDMSEAYSRALGVAPVRRRSGDVPRQSWRHVPVHRMRDANFVRERVLVSTWPLYLFVRCPGCGAVDALRAHAFFARARRSFDWLELLYSGVRKLDVLRPVSGGSDAEEVWEDFLEHDGRRAVCPDCFAVLWPNGGWRAAEVVRRSTASAPLYAETVLLAPQPRAA